MAIRTSDRVLVTEAAARCGLALTRVLAARGRRVLACERTVEIALRHLPLRVSRRMV
jgi:NAD(P)-dependent dehydrogenase (short-subunit alcohol dehydrogenase family)